MYVIEKLWEEGKSGERGTEEIKHNQYKEP